jgi:hypothetical protein
MTSTLINPHIFALVGNDAYTTVLLHMDGADAGTTFTDSNAGGSAHTWTANGNAQLDTADKKFGSASLLLDGTGDYLSTPDHADWAMGSGEFTYDLWFKVAGGDGANRVLMSDANAGGSLTGVLIYLNTANKVLAQTTAGGSKLITGTSTFVAAGATWNHVAYVRTGDVLRLFVNGTQEGGDLAVSGAVNNSDGAMMIGKYGELATLYWNGWIDEVRISKGLARWTANFTPPTAAYA